MARLNRCRTCRAYLLINTHFDIVVCSHCDWPCERRWCRRCRRVERSVAPLINN